MSKAKIIGVMFVIWLVTVILVITSGKPHAEDGPQLKKYKIPAVVCLAGDCHHVLVKTEAFNDLNCKLTAWQQVVNWSMQNGYDSVREVGEYQDSSSQDI